MGSIRKFGKNAWQLDYVDARGRRIRQVVRLSKKDAQAYLGKLVNAARVEKYFPGEKMEENVGFEELLEKYAETFSHQVYFQRTKRFHLNLLREYFRDRRVREVGAEDLEKFKLYYARRRTRGGKHLSKASVNRMLSTLRHLMGKAEQWGFVKQSPFVRIRGKGLFEREENQRVRFLTREEETRLLECASASLRPILACAINSGLRKGEIFKLKWEDVFLEEGFLIVRPSNSKTRNGREVPLNRTLGEVLARLKTQSNKGFVFTNERGEKVKSVRTAFKGACKRAGIENLHFHDLRHHFASWLVMRGVNLRSVQQLLGHRTLAVTIRYSHLSDRVLKDAVETLDLKPGDSTFETGPGGDSGDFDPTFPPPPLATA